VIDEDFYGIHLGLLSKTDLIDEIPVGLLSDKDQKKGHVLYRKPVQLMHKFVEQQRHLAPSATTDEDILAQVQQGFKVGSALVCIVLNRTTPKPVQPSKCCQSESCTDQLNVKHNDLHCAKMWPALFALFSWVIKLLKRKRGKGGGKQSKVSFQIQYVRTKEWKGQEKQQSVRDWRLAKLSQCFICTFVGQRLCYKL
jgi:hypothetical protein